MDRHRERRTIMEKPTLRSTSPIALLFLLSLMLLGLIMGTSPYEDRHLLDSDSADRSLSSFLAEQNLVLNGSFENDFEGWEKLGRPDSLLISTSTVHAGTRALEVRTSSGANAWIRQPVNVAYDSTVIVFWIYPSSETSGGFFSLTGIDERGWGYSNSWITFQGSGSAVFETVDASLVTVRDTIVNAIISNSWNKVMIQANGVNETQHLFINDSLVSSLTAPWPFNIPANLVQIGDQNVHQNGTMYFDDLYIASIDSAQGIIAIEDECIVTVDDSHTCTVKVIDNDRYTDGTSVWVKSVSQPSSGRAAINYSDNSRVDYSWRELPFSLTDGFTYTITNGIDEATAAVIVLFDCGCHLTYEDCLNASPKKEYALDSDLLHRFRDEWLLPTVDGARYVDYYYNLPEILRIFILTRPDLRPRFVALAEMLQPSIRNALEGDGMLPITQAQMDSVTTFFADLSAAGSESLQQLITDEMGHLGSLDAYVGKPVGDVLNTILGDPVGTAIEEEPPGTSTDFVLEQNFPNPFNTSTQIRYTLARPGPVTVSIYDIQGRKVATLIEGNQGQGVQSVVWDGVDESGVAVPSGTYFVRLITPTYQSTKKMIIRR